MPRISKYTMKNRGGFGSARAPYRVNDHQYIPQEHVSQHPYRGVYRGQRRSDRGRNRPSSSLKFQHPRSTEPQPHYQQVLPTRSGNNSNVKTLLCNMIKDLMPLNTVTGFQHLARSLQPSLQIPLNASMVQTELQSLYRQKRREVHNSVNDASNLVLSAELWSSNEAMFYLTVSCHLINENWMQKSYMLDTAHMLNDHTPEHAVKQLLRIANEWNITEKIEGVVTNVDGIKSVHMGACKWTHVPCFAHTLDKVFRETLSESDWHLMRKCQRIVVFFHESNKASESLRKHCSRLKLKLSQSRELTQMNEHWPSALHMLRNILEQWPAIYEVFAENQKDDLCLNENERKTLNDIVLVLNNLKEVTEKIIGSQGYSPISNIIPLFQKLQEKVRNQAMMGNRIAQKLSESCDYHIGSIKKNNWFRISTMLDPRHKTCLLWDPDIKTVKNEIRSQISTNTQSGHGSHDTGNEELILEKYWKIRSISENPLEFWRSKADLKQLAAVARRYLTIVSTAIPIERVHQLEESQAINRRNSIEPKNLNMILFLNAN